MSEDPRRALPSVDSLAARLGVRPEPHGMVTEAARRELEGARTAAAAGQAPEQEALVRRLAAELDRGVTPSLRRVINASGVLLQTNLGRAPLGRKALEAMADVAAASNLEYDLESGGRGSRHEHVRELIRRTTGAADGIAVNNNAAALFMVLQAFCQGREVIVSRGQAVEIGGGFRIPDVLRQSGARLVEVGTTNRTYAEDYAAAITPETAAILRVHASNFKVIGFTAEPSSAELAEVARRHGVRLFDDLGSGCLVNTEDYGLEHEQTVQESLAAGVDLALFSGDKLLGGPQAGIIAGDAGLVGELRRHPLARALRLDKFAIAALNATLLSYVFERQDTEVPLWRMLRASEVGLKRRAGRWAKAGGEGARAVPATTMVGGGSLPGQGAATWCTELRSPQGASDLAGCLRDQPVPVIGRIEREGVLLDPRTVDPSDDRSVAEAITNALSQLSR